MVRDVPVSIRDVAKHVGVTIGTVSRAFNGYEDIRPETRERILKAAAELGYVPNVSARNLSAKKPPNIALIISGLLEGDPKDNLVYLMFQGVYSYALANGLEIAVYATDSMEQRHKSYAQFCKEHSISGAILSGITTDDAYFSELVASSIPCVAVDVPLHGPGQGWVSVDNALAAEEIAGYLFGIGHRDIVIIGGKDNAAVHLERMEGVARAFARADVMLSPAQVLHADFSEQHAYEAVSKYLQETPREDHCTAFCCFSDIMALGAIAAVREAGYRVPEDFSVTGFDGLVITQYTSPTLTTVAQDMRTHGAEAARMLHAIMQGEEGEHRVSPHSIEVRGSTAAPAQAVGN